MNKLLVTGATGHLGQAVIHFLLTRIPASHISIITRKEEKRAEFQSKGFNAYLGSYGDTDSLASAMTGIDTLLLISSGDQGNRIQEHQNVIDMAKAAGVKNIAYTSRSLRDRTTLANQLMTEHFETEDRIKASGLNYLFFRNILYMDAIPQFIGGASALKQGIFLPAGQGKVAFALRKEMGEAMAHVLLNKPFENKTYHFTGARTYSFDDVAIALSELSGKDISYTDVDARTFEELMTQKGLPQPLIQKIADFITDIRNNQEADVYSDLEEQLGRKPTGLKEGLKVLFEL